MPTNQDLRFQDNAPRIHSTARLKETKLGHYSEIGERVILHDCTIGRFSYFERNSEAIYTDIGHFCSIASNVRLNALEHPMERVTTHKVSYRPNEYFRYLKLDNDFREKRKTKRVTIGHDVWIGHGAVIMPGLTIGTGAIIGANAVVTKNVAPYAIVVGVPAQQNKFRFAPDIIEILLKMAWWNWPLPMLYDAIEDMQKMDIKDFINKYHSVSIKNM